jgi:class 3 adenylate cyclase/tetratricopeptide (TPR) repeat protein
MKCGACQSDNPPGSRFCEQCGSSLAARCPKCGEETRPDAKFCRACGQRLAPALEISTETPAPLQPTPVEPASLPSAVRAPSHLAEKILAGRAAIEGERRQVTALSGDIAGYTAMGEKLDPEDVRAIIAPGFQLVAAEIHRFEGTIIAYGGDGLMALFGAPIAHEDAPRRAIHAALAIQQALRDYGKQLERGRGLNLRMRIGVNSGTVVVGKIGDDLHMEYTAIGDTINLASRLQSAARPGSVVISEATHKAAPDLFDTLDLGELALKGHAPVRAYEVLRERGRRARLEAATERGLTPLVGRERELAALDDLFGQVIAGAGQVALVAGEAGIGKSRLLLEFRNRRAAAGDEVTWLEGRCVSFGQSTPMLPVIDQVRENFGIEEIDEEPEIIAKVENGMRQMGGLEQQIPYLRYLLSVDPGDPAVAEMDTSARRKRMFDALRALAMRGASLRPLVLVVEDLHWADTSTIEYLESLMDSVAGARLMLICTYRVGYTPGFGTRSFQTTVNLHHLTDAQALQMATGVLGAADFPDELKAALTQKAEGVPLFVEEVTKTLLELGFLSRDNGHYRMLKKLDDTTVPDTIQGIIMARLDRLGGDGKRAVQLASVIGRQFVLRLLERVAGLTGKLEGLLQELKALEIVYEQGLLPEPAYIFKHAVIQDVAYNSLLLQQRKELHRAVGGAIQELYPDRLTEHYSELAHHFIRAEDWPNALEYSRLAGDQAAQSYSNVEAEQHYARALAAAAKMPLVEPGALADLYAKRGAVLNIVGRVDDAIADYQRAQQIVHSAGDRKREVQVLLGLIDVYTTAHQQEPMLEYSHQALALARETGDKELEALCATMLQFCGMCFGPNSGAEKEAEQTLSLAETTGNPRLRAYAHEVLAFVLQWQADFDRSIPHLRQALQLAVQIHNGRQYGDIVFHLGCAYFSKGDYEEALRWFGRCAEYADGAGDKYLMAQVPNLSGGVHLELYDLDEALKINLESYEIACRLSPWTEPRGHSLTKAGLAYFELGDFALADKYFLRAWELLEDKDEFIRWRWQMVLLRGRGELALASGQRDEAWKFATESLDLASKTVSRKHIARAQWLQGEILAASGRLDEAAKTLDASATLAEQIGTPREIWIARSALGHVLTKLGRDKEVESQFQKAANAIETVSSKVKTPALSRSFLNAAPIRAVYKALNRKPPPTIP